VVIFFGLAVTASAQKPVLETVRVISIPGIPLPVVVAKEHGIFGEHGLEVQAEAAPNSGALRAALATGEAAIAHAAVDNALAMDETADVAIVMGGESSLNELIAQPSIHSLTELRGKIVIVDAPNTAFALQLKKILLDNGLRAGRDYEIKPAGTTPQRLEAMQQHKEYAASILGPPTSILAKREGFVRLASTQDFVGAYQAGGAFVTRPWAHDHANTLVRYLAACIEAQRWLLGPANQQQVADLLMKHWHLPAPVAQETYRLMKDQRWFEDDARLDLDAFRNVLKLRAEVEGQWDGRPPAPEKYYDPSYYQKALAKLDARP
jgi:ABC-type nitrate/sulfonate/bicarbonate transport system substrate-binding protein